MISIFELDVQAMEMCLVGDWLFVYIF